MRIFIAYRRSFIKRQSEGVPQNGDGAENRGRAAELCELREGGGAHEGDDLPVLLRCRIPEESG